MKKAELVKLLKALKENSIGLARYYEDKDSQIEKRYLIRTNTLTEVIMLLTDKDYANQIKDIFLPES